MKRKLITLLFFALSCMSVLLSGEKLSINILPVSVRQRTGAPVPVIVQSNWSGTAPITGFLTIKIISDGREKCSVKTAEITFPPGRQSRSMLLPPVTGNSEYSMQTNLRIFFQTEKHRYIIPLQNLTMIEQNLRAFNVLIASNNLIRHRKSNPGNELRLEKLVKKDDQNYFFGRSGTTYIPANQMPAKFAEYCAYNIVLLQGEAFADMTKKALSTLQKWVLAGGSLCIIPEKTELSMEHINFINGLLSENMKSKPHFYLNGGGVLQWPDNSDSDKSAVFHSGLGRVVIIPGKISSPEYFRKTPWRYAAAFLWRVRSDRIESVVNNGVWFNNKKERANSVAAQYTNAYNNNFRNSYRDTSSVTGELTGFLQLFLPPEFRTIPSWVVITILLTLMLTVGPIDYYILGKINRRKLTWYIFPVVCLIFSAVTVYLADYYMGVHDHIGRLQIIDEGKDGKILRKTTYEIIFPGASKTMYRQCRNEFCCKQYSDYPSVQKFSGRLFSDYTVSFKTRQWIPVINKINSYFPGEKAKHSLWSFPEKWNKKSVEKFKHLNCFSKSGVYVAERYLGTDILLTGKGDSFISALMQLMDSKYRDSVYSFLNGESPSPEYGDDFLIMTDGTDSSLKLAVVSVYNPSERKMTVYRRLYIGNQ